jgi:TonB family protein
VLALHAGSACESGMTGPFIWLVVLAGMSLGMMSLRAQPQSDSASAASASSENKVPLAKRVRVSSGVMGGLLLRRVRPNYRDEARSAGIQGMVNLRAIVSKTGDVTDLQVVSGPPELAEAAMKAVRKWKYNPFLIEGEPVEAETTVQVNFALAYR